MSDSRSGFEYWGRKAKVERLVAAVDKHLDEHGIDKQAPGVAAGLRHWTLDAWIAVADNAKPKIRKPSPKTIAEVIAAYETREKGRAA